MHATPRAGSLRRPGFSLACRTVSRSDLALDNRRIWEAGAQAFVDRRVEIILSMLPALGPGRATAGRRLSRRPLHASLRGKGGDRATPSASTYRCPRTRGGTGSTSVEFDLNSKEPLPHPDASFEVVVCIETLEHVYPTDHLVREIRPAGQAGRNRHHRRAASRLLPQHRIAGTLGFQPPGIECSREARYGSINRDSVLTGHVAYFTRRALLELLRASGFEILRGRAR